MKALIIAGKTVLYAATFGLAFSLIFGTAYAVAMAGGTIAVLLGADPRHEPIFGIGSVIGLFLLFVGFWIAMDESASEVDDGEYQVDRHNGERLGLEEAARLL